MNENSPILLIGVGGAGCAIAHGVSRAFGESMRHVLCDTDAVSARENSRFILLGGDRLSGHGSGGDVAQARLAAEDSKHAFDELLEGVRLAVIVTSLGGGTGGGFGDVAMTAMFIGLVSAYIGSYLGKFISGNGLFTFSGDWTPIAVAAVSALVMAGFVYLAEKKQKAWVESFSVAGSMIVGMAAAVVIGLLVK